MKEKKYKMLYIVSYVGEYSLMHSRLIINFDALEDYSKELHSKAIQYAQKIFDCKDNYFFKLYYLSGTDEELQEIAKINRKYLFKLLNQSYGDEADYVHCDYFLDLVDQFKQFCEQIKAKELYNKTIDKLKKHQEYCDDEEIEFERIA